jgi:phosphoribosyl 1,2-cyclic phosphodiesterase
MMSFPMVVRFWGVRGSIPCPGADHDRYGGNTPCVEIVCGDHVLIFDAGTGIRRLGHSLMKAGKATHSDIFFSHCHLDHVIGLPFFTPLFHPGSEVHLWAGHLEDQAGVENALRKVMSFPLFPIEVETFQAHLKFHDFKSGDRLNPRPDVVVETAPLNHPGGSTGYRIEYGGRSVAYLTDVELGDGPFDKGIMALARNADVMIIDATYTDKELLAHIGWGHSSWQQCSKFADATGVKTAYLFHHDPDHDDEFMDEVDAAAQRTRPGLRAAREGDIIEL